MIFGLPFFLAGIAMVLTAAGAFPVQEQSGGLGLSLTSGAMGLAFLVVGGVMVFGRRWLVLDLDRGSVLRQLGLLVPMRTDERRLGEFNAVVISRNPGDSESVERFPVKLRASIGKELAIARPGQYGESRILAEFLARVLQLPLSDATSGFETTISPERLGESLSDRLRAEAPLAQPVRPPAMRCKVEESAGAVKIVLPGGGPGPVGYLGLILPLVLCVFAILYVTTIASPQTNRIRLLDILLFLFGVPTIIAGIRFLIASKRKETTVTASAAGIIIEPPHGRGTHRTEIPVSELLDLDCSTTDSAIASARRDARVVDSKGDGNERIFAAMRKLVPNPGIIVKSRSGLVTVGEGLPAEELRYVVWLLQKALSS